MIRVHTWDKPAKEWAVEEHETQLSVVASTGRQEMVSVYVDCKSLSEGAAVRIDLAVSESLIGDTFYAVSQWVSNAIEPVFVLVNKAGQYRFPVPVTGNEDQIKLSIEASGVVDADIHILPADARL